MRKLIAVVLIVATLGVACTPACSYHERGMAQLKRQDYIAAVQSLHQAVSMSPRDTGYRIALARAYAGLGICDESDYQMSKAVEIDGRDESQRVPSLCDGASE